MRRFWLFIKFWLPPLLWMSLIFIGSADRASVNRSSRIVAPIVRWLLPSASEETVDHCVFAARKGAHLTEYALFAILLWRALRQHTRQDQRPWTWREPKWALVGVFAYACLDELHQVFVPGRGPALHDVLLDTLGGAVGLLLLWWVGRLAKRWSPNAVDCPSS